MASEPKFPDVWVPLVGHDGNAFGIIARVSRALHEGGASHDEKNAFASEAMSGDYSHLLRTVAEWVNIESEEDYW
jgi:hypothetical protein